MITLPKIAVPIFRNKDKIVFDNRDGTFTAIYNKKIHRYPNDSANYAPSVDGYIVDGHACGEMAVSTGQYMYTGTMDLVCLNDDMRDVSRSYASFDTSDLAGATISEADVHFYWTSKTKSSKIFLWNAGYTPQFKVNVGSDLLGASLDTGDWSMGGTTIATVNRLGFDAYAAGYKIYDCLGYVNQSGKTDFMLWFNQDFEDEMQNDGKYYYFTWQTVETAFANKDPKLVVVYTPAPSERISHLPLLGVG